MSVPGRTRTALLASLLVAIVPARADDASDLETVVVQSSVLVESSARQELDREDIAATAASSLDEVLARVPNVKVQRNSRGEQVFALRGSDQRQVALTLDGAPLVSAWDGQLDLSLVPTSALESIAITRGPASVLQGPNALAGATNLISRRGGKLDWSQSFSGTYSSQWQGFEGFVGHRGERAGYAAAVAVNESDGYEAGGEDDLLAGSDFKAHSALLGWTFEGEEASTGLSLLLVDNSKGVVPERTSSVPRYWRYPQLQKTLLTWYGHQPVPIGALHYSFYVDRGEAQIDQYTDETFTTRSNVEDGQDRATGGRVQWKIPFADTQAVSLGLNYNRSKHLFRERGTSEDWSEFSQVLSQVAAEWSNETGPWSLRVGGAWEHFDNPDTGSLPEPAALEDWAGSAVARYRFANDIGVDLMLGRKTRFPSLRESYNGALGRFVVNPELGQETAESAALGLTGRHANWNWETRAFATFISDGIARAALPNGRFTRVNQTRSRIVGVEFGVDGSIADRARTRFEGTVLRARARSASAEYEDFLEYRPGINLGLDVTFDLGAQWRLDLGGRYLAQEYGLIHSSPTPQELPSYLLWNAALERDFDVAEIGEFSVALRLENAADEYYQVQWGLPGTGRRASLRVNWNR